MTAAGSVDAALDAWEVLVRRCLSRRRGLVLAHDGPGRLAAGAALWPLSQVLAAGVAVAGLTGDLGVVDGLLAGLERYRIGDAYGPHPGQAVRYYDDNAWVGLVLTQLHAQTGEASHLARAGRVFGFVASGEAPGGGVWWVEQPKGSRHTCSTAPAEQLALRLADAGEAGLDPGELEAFADRQDRWLRSTLQAPSGLYWDNVDNQGRVEPTHWSYNQGTPAGADMLWWRRTGDISWRRRAEATAAAALDHYGGDDRLWRQPAVFNAVFFRNLLPVAGSVPELGIVEVLDAYLDRALATAADRRTGLLTGGGIGRYEGGGTIDHAGLVQLLAYRAWPPERWASIC